VKLLTENDVKIIKALLWLTLLMSIAELARFVRWARRSVG
jgi:hypothetical protein